MHVSYSVDYDAIAAHVRERFKDARIIDKPYPHMTLDGVLPDDYYDMLLDALPLPQDVGSDNSGALNFAVFEQDAHFSRMTPARRQLWTKFDRRISQPVIRQELIRLFNRYLPLKFDMMLDSGWTRRAQAALGDDWRDRIQSGDVYQPEGGSGGRILLVTRNFNLVPHVDNATSVLTYLFYMPRDDSRPELGTKVHVVGNESKACKEYRERKNIDVWLVKPEDLTEESFVFPYRRNSLAAMLCLPTSAHSITCNEINYCRYAMQTQIFIRDDLSDALFEGWTAKGVNY